MVIRGDCRHPSDALSQLGYRDCRLWSKHRVENEQHLEPVARKSSHDCLEKQL